MGGGTEAFPNLGAHCSDPSCRQLDFLPFKCDACSQVFCLEHRSYTAHSCARSGAKDSTVVICPLCASGVRTVPGEDPNLTIEKHLPECDPSNYQRVMNKPRCKVRGCKELLTTSNKFHCKACRRDVCLKHRFAPDHGCQQTQTGNAAAAASSKAGDLANRFFRAMSLRSGTECGSSSSSSSGSSSRADKSRSSSKWPRIF